jgi:sec-independent protein translocase protein TatB
VLALLLFGPNKLPEMAKMLGKGMREFQKATNDIRSTVETEINKLGDVESPPAPLPNGGRNVIKLDPPPGAVAANEPVEEHHIAPPSPEAPVAAPPAQTGEKGGS